MTRTGLVALFIVCVTAAVPRPSAAEWFVDAYLGKSFTHDSDLKINQPANNSRFTVRNFSYDDESFASPPYYGARGGYFFHSLPWLGVSIDFIHFKTMGETGDNKRFVGTRNGAPINVVQPVNTVIQKFDISHGLNYLTLNAILRHGFLAEMERFPQGRLQAYIGAGPALVIAHPENQIEGVENSQKYEIAGAGVHTFAGMKWLLFRNFGIFGEYKLTYSRPNVDLRVGDAKLNAITHHTVFGITVPFP